MEVIGAEKELSKGFLEMDQNKIRRFLQNLGSDWMIWKNNPPAGSHFGGIWECQIRSARTVLGSLLRTHGSSLNDEALNTLMIEVESIVNSRPLIIETIADGTSEAAISPSNLLTRKSKIVMPPSESFGYQISTAEEDGEEFNTFSMNFGGRNSLLHFQHNQNGAN